MHSFIILFFTVLFIPLTAKAQGSYVEQFYQNNSDFYSAHSDARLRNQEIERLRLLREQQQLSQFGPRRRFLTGDIPTSLTDFNIGNVRILDTRTDPNRDNIRIIVDQLTGQRFFIVDDRGN